MIYPYPFDREKALECVLYLASNVDEPDLHRISKLLYFADKRHLELHGRLLYGDQYVAMQYGPVPSKIYGVLKGAGDAGSQGAGDAESRKPDLATLVESARIALSVKGHVVKPLREADTLEFSDSDQECLDWAINEYGNCTFDELSRLGHAEEAWKQAAKNAAKNAPVNVPINVEAMTIGARNREALLADLRDPFPGEAE